jgi:hypothetical protein
MEPSAILDYFLDLPCQDALIRSQNCCNSEHSYSGILILFNLLTLVVILRFSTRGIKL